MKYCHKRLAPLLLTLALSLSLVPAASAQGITYMPGVTAEMSGADYWAALYDDAQEVILAPEEIEAFNADTCLASGTMVMDLRTADETFDGKARNKMIRSSSTADAEYYFGWTYGPDGKKADWDYYEDMIRNCIDPRAKTVMPVRYAVAVKRTVLQVFPAEDPIWDDPNDPDFNYQYLSAVHVNDPMLIYTTSRDGKYYLARSRDCSGWIPAEDVALCKDKEEWLSAWDIPADKVLVVYGNKEYTDASNSAPDTARRMLTQGTTLELVTGLVSDQLVNNRYPYHNYVVYLPVRREDGSYEKQMALLPETAKVSVGYLPLTMENIAMVALNNLGDAYGWGGMMDVEDCSGLVRTIYSCFGLDIGRNGNWQWNMSIEKIDTTYMSLEEKIQILDELPLGAALCFSGHEMLYLGKVDGKHYVISTVSSIMSPETGNRLRTRDVMINTLDVKRANGQSWVQALNKIMVPYYATTTGRDYGFPDTAWYHEGRNYCLVNKLLTAEADGTLGIGKIVNRSELANALWTMAGKPVVNYVLSFTDVAEDDLYTEAIRWAVSENVMTGYDDGCFGAEDTVSRQQMLTALWRYAQKHNVDVSVGEDTNILSYEDAFDISEYAIPAMQWACGAGIIAGTGEGKIQPEGALTREQISVILYRYSQLPSEDSEAVIFD